MYNNNISFTVCSDTKTYCRKRNKKYATTQRNTYHICSPHASHVHTELYFTNRDKKSKLFCVAHPSLAAACRSSSRPSFSLYTSQSIEDLATVDTSLGPLIVLKTWSRPPPGPFFLTLSCAWVSAADCSTVR